MLLEPPGAYGTGTSSARKFPRIANKVEILEREANGIHDAVARRADRLASMQLHSFAQRFGFARIRFLIQIRFHSRRRIRCARSEKIFKNPLAALHRRRAICCRSHHQHAALPRTPRRGSSFANVTRRKKLPLTLGMP